MSIPQITLLAISLALTGAIILMFKLKVDRKPVGVAGLVLLGILDVSSILGLASLFLAQDFLILLGI